MDVSLCEHRRIGLRLKTWMDAKENIRNESGGLNEVRAGEKSKSAIIIAAVNKKLVFCWCQDIHKVHPSIYPSGRNNPPFTSLLLSLLSPCPSLPLCSNQSHLLLLHL